MTQSPSSLSVIIVNWNTRDLLAACLHALAQPGGMPDGTEVIVVDNASTDDSVPYLRTHFPWVSLIVEPTNGGFAVATNRGLALANGEYLLLLNSDTEVQPGALAAMCACLRTLPHVGAVGADIHDPSGAPQPCAGDAPSLLSETWSILGMDRKGRALVRRFHAPATKHTFAPTDWVLGAALMTRRTVYDAIGPLDEGYFLYSEEVDWCTRIRKSGWQVGVLTGAVILHHGGGSTRRTPDQMRPALFRSKVRYLSIHRGVYTAQVFRAIVHIVARFHVASGTFVFRQETEEVTSWEAVRDSV